MDAVFPSILHFPLRCYPWTAGGGKARVNMKEQVLCEEEKGNWKANAK